MELPVVSIITPSFNQARFLPATLASIRSQDYPQIDHIVVDGGSTDGTIEILQQTSGLRWISEPDHGQVDALNKGFKMARGAILTWLNADDLYCDGTVRQAVAVLQRNAADLVYGDLDIINEAGEWLREFRGIPFDRRVLVAGINYIGQQTAFFRRELLETVGPLRAEFDNAFDYELWLRMARHGRLLYVPGLRAQIRKHAAAKSIARSVVTDTDTQRVRQEYWADTGLPSWLGRPPWFLLTNYWFRLKRQWQLRSRGLP